MCPRKSENLSQNGFFQKSMQMLKQISQEESFGLAVLDDQLRFVTVNDEFAVYNDVPSGQHRGKTMREMASSLNVALGPTLTYVLDERKPLLNLEFELTPDRAVGDYAQYLKVSCHPLQTEDGVVQGVGIVVKDITDQKRKDREQADRLRFEAILTEFSATFINMQIGDVDNRIEQSLKSVNDFLGFDRITVWQFSPDDGRLYLTHSHVDANSPPEVQPPHFLDEVVPVWVDLARKGQTFFISRIRNFPITNGVRENTAKSMGE